MKKATFNKAPFRVLATLIAVEALLIGQQVIKPAPAYAQEKKAEDCKLVNPVVAQDCWMRKVQAGEKNLQEAKLYVADLRKVDLSGADLVAADLSKANLSGANLSGAELYGAILGGANLKGANLDGIKKDGTTKGL